MSKHINALIKKTQQSTSRNNRRNTNRRGSSCKKKSAVKFKDAWKRYKDLFSYAQFEKCGFCESNITKSGYGDVEHYYPKAEVWELSDADGKRVKRVLSTLGYWWLAYDWKNYLFACPKCNQKFKGSYFPVKQKARRLPPNERPTKKFPKETPLLLNPYGRVDPGKHLQLEGTGVVTRKNHSLYGYETIRICGLNRIELIRAREGIALRALELVQSLAKRGNSRNLSVLKDIYLLGCDSAEHVGMVREFFKDSGLSWETLVRLYAQEICNQLKTANSGQTAALEVCLEPMGRERYEHWKRVRDIFEESSKTTWNSLVRKRAEQLMRELLKAQRQLDTTHLNLLESRVYEMVRESPSSLNTVADIFETRSGQSWADLEKAVSTRATL
ncbi:MAG TPA: hypothetical protein VN843_23780 [Anaerolineales bacterium]|nr:hypothetical protein [Anaerolineales bacterium]